MSKKMKLEIKQEQEELEERIRSERIETSDVATKPEVKDENEPAVSKPEVKDENEQVVKIENPDDSADLGNSILYCIGNETFVPDQTADRWNHVPGLSISYLSNSLTTPHWTTIDWPHPRLSPGTVVHDHKLYIIGGNEGYINKKQHEDICAHFSQLTYLDTIEVFDLRTKSWLPVRRLPFGIARPRVCSLGDYIYIGGGIRKQGEMAVLGGLWRYCPISGRFEERQRSTGRVLTDKSALLSLNGFLYALSGGNYHNNPHLSIERYDLAADQWSLLQTSTNNYQQVWRMTVTVHRGKIYILTDIYGLEVYCPEAGSWTRLGDTPDEGDRKMFGELASINNRLVSVGNLCCEPHFRVYEFDFEAAVWIRRADRDTPQNRFSVQVYNPSG